MTTKTRLEKLEKQNGKQTQTEDKRHLVEVGNRFFDLTNSRQLTTIHELLSLAISPDADETARRYIAFGFPEITRAEYDELTRRGLNTNVQIDYAKLLGTVNHVE